MVQPARYHAEFVREGFYEDFFSLEPFFTNAVFRIQDGNLMDLGDTN